MQSPVHQAIDAVWRIESAKIIAGVARLVRDIGLAEELALDRAQAAAQSPGPYLLQAAIAACHAPAATASDTDWKRIAGLYGTLAQVQPSPVVELNLAVAVAMAFGPAAGLAIIDALRNDRSLRGDLLARLGRNDEARAESNVLRNSHATSGNANCCCSGPHRLRTILPPVPVPDSVQAIAAIMRWG